MEILNIYQSASDDAAFMWFWLVYGGVLLIVAVVSIIIDCNDILSYVGIVLGTFLITITGCALHNSNKITYYEVRFDDTITVNEIMSKYDIIEQRGNIYTITEKDID